MLEHRALDSWRLFPCNQRESIASKRGTQRDCATRPHSTMTAATQIGDVAMSNDRAEAATFGGGCFWCLEAVFERLRGVVRVESGYAGGARPNPSYEQVCTGVSGHAEVVRITFNPTVVSYRELLDLFFVTHNPTTLNRQGAD